MGLRVENLTKRFGPFTAVDDVSAVVEDGERVCLLGPNGSGKTTLLRMLAGLSKPTDGTVQVDGEGYATASARIRRTVGYVSHETMLYENLTARENLGFHARLRGLPESRVDEVLEQVGLRRLASGLPREFSHGMKKRLSLARAELGSPSVLLLDEPFSGLDQFSVRTVETILEDRTLVLVTHEFERAFDTCDRFLVLSNGSLELDFETSEVADADELRERYWNVVR